MCGIAGFQYQNLPQLNEQILSSMLAAISHRGPDAQGTYLNKERGLGLGHVRLSILDLSERGNQPMFSFDNRYVLVYNGEIYNFKEIRLKLSQKGYHFKSETDTEVILNAFHCWNTESFSLYNGMFAFALYDTIEDELFLVRDPLGIKPLYYHQDKSGIEFSSEIKAILATGNYKFKLSQQGLAQYLWYGNAHGINTFYKGIYKLEPGHFLKVKGGEILALEKYYDLSKPIYNKTYNEAEIVDEIKNQLEAAVKRHLISDVPVGVFLSGGIDSSAITAFASKHYAGRINTYSVGFDFAKGPNELKSAAAIARHFGTNHHEIFIKGIDLVSVFEKLVYHHDEPFGDAANIPLYLLTAQLSGAVKVVLQGDGGDELFGGYSRYHTLQKKHLYSLFNTPLSLVPDNINHPKLLQMKRFSYAISRRDKAIRNALLLTMETPGVSPYRFFNKQIQADLQKLDPFVRYKQIYKSFTNESDVDCLFNADLKVILPDTFLEKVDKSTMANSIEVRVPFLDKELVDYMSTIPASIKVQGGIQKKLLKQALRQVVPDFVLDGKKTGFSVPYGYWLMNDMHAYLQDQLLNSSYFSNWINRDKLEKAIKLHKDGKANNGFLLWKLLNLAVWANKNKVTL